MNNITACTLVSASTKVRAHCSCSSSLVAARWRFLDKRLRGRALVNRRESSGSSTNSDNAKINQITDRSSKHGQLSEQLSKLVPEKLSEHAPEKVPELGQFEDQKPGIEPEQSSDTERKQKPRIVQDQTSLRFQPRLQVPSCNTLQQLPLYPSDKSLSNRQDEEVGSPSTRDAENVSIQAEKARTEQWQKAQRERDVPSLLTWTQMIREYQRSDPFLGQKKPHTRRKNDTEEGTESQDTQQEQHEQHSDEQHRYEKQQDDDEVKYILLYEKYAAHDVEPSIRLAESRIIWNQFNALPSDTRTDPFAAIKHVQNLLRDPNTRVQASLLAVGTVPAIINGYVQPEVAQELSLLEKPGHFTTNGSSQSSPDALSDNQSDSTSPGLPYNFFDGTFDSVAEEIPKDIAAYVASQSKQQLQAAASIPKDILLSRLIPEIDSLICNLTQAEFASEALRLMIALPTMYRDSWLKNVFSPGTLFYLSHVQDLDKILRTFAVNATITEKMVPELSSLSRKAMQILFAARGAGNRRRAILGLIQSYIELGLYMNKQTLRRAMEFCIKSREPAVAIVLFQEYSRGSVQEKLLCLHAHAICDDINICRQFFDDNFGSANQTYAPAYKMMMETYAKNGDTSAAEALFNQFLMFGGKPTSDLFSPLIRMRKDRIEVEKATHWLATMKQYGCDPSIEQLNLVLSTMRRAKQTRRFFEFFSLLQRTYNESDLADAKLQALMVCRQTGNIELARNIFDSISEEVLSKRHVAVMMEIFNRSGKFDEAVNVYRAAAFRDSRNKDRLYRPLLHSFEASKNKEQFSKLSQSLGRKNNNVDPRYVIGVLREAFQSPGMSAKTCRFIFHNRLDALPKDSKELASIWSFGIYNGLYRDLNLDSVWYLFEKYITSRSNASVGYRAMIYELSNRRQWRQSTAVELIRRYFAIQDRASIRWSDPLRNFRVGGLISQMNRSRIANQRNRMGRPFRLYLKEGRLNSMRELINIDSGFLNTCIKCFVKGNALGSAWTVFRLNRSICFQRKQDLQNLDGAHGFKMNDAYISYAFKLLAGRVSGIQQVFILLKQYLVTVAMGFNLSMQCRDELFRKLLYAGETGTALELMNELLLKQQVSQQDLQHRPVSKRTLALAAKIFHLLEHQTAELHVEESADVDANFAENDVGRLHIISELNRKYPAIRHLVNSDIAMMAANQNFKSSDLYKFPRLFNLGDSKFLRLKHKIDCLFEEDPKLLMDIVDDSKFRLTLGKMAMLIKSRKAVSSKKRFNQRFILMGRRSRAILHEAAVQRHTTEEEICKVFFSEVVHGRSRPVLHASKLRNQNEAGLCLSQPSQNCNIEVRESQKLK